MIQLTMGNGLTSFINLYLEAIETNATVNINVWMPKPMRLNKKTIKLYPLSKVEANTSFIEFISDQWMT